MSMARRTDNTPMPDKIGHLLQESRWLGVGALMVFLVMALWGFQRSDPGWSNAVGAGALQNPAGRLGAWVADVLLYVFGLSAWWWVVLLGMWVWWGFRRLHSGQKSSPPWFPRAATIA